jgi:hypothetical protein
MRDEDDIQRVADKTSDRINRKDTEFVHIEYLRGVLDALDWVLDEDMEDDPA